MVNGSINQAFAKAGFALLTMYKVTAQVLRGWAPEDDHDKSTFAWQKTEFWAR